MGWVRQYVSTTSEAGEHKKDAQPLDDAEKAQPLPEGMDLDVAAEGLGPSEQVLPPRREVSSTGRGNTLLKRPPLQPVQTQLSLLACDRQTSGLRAEEIRAVGSAPLACRDDQEYPLVGREQECGELDRFLKESLGAGAGQGRSLYVSGGPGTGKTCSVRAGINEHRKSAPDVHTLEVNCMDLTQRSLSGVLQQLLLKMDGRRAPGMSMQGLAALVASGLAKVSKRVVIVVDEVDQLVSRAERKAAEGALSLETLFSIPRLLGAPAVAIIAIANAVDLLERTMMSDASSMNCSTLLFEPYSKDQLKKIVTVRVGSASGGDAALKALGGIKVQLHVTRVAKESGDCRQVMSLIEEGLSEAKYQYQHLREVSEDSTTTSEGIAASTTKAVAADTVSPRKMDQEQPAKTPRRDPRKLIQPNRNDPLQAIKALPLEQQILLATLAISKHEATKLSDVCNRYKELCRDLKQPDNLGSHGQVSCALSQLEHRGLLEIHSHRGVKFGRGSASMAKETTIELNVACGELLKAVVGAKPELERFIK